jgi:AcrR family transcriptional regulator
VTKLLVSTRIAWSAPAIAERGLEGMSTREVLARTGAPRGSVYHYFPRGRTELIELAIDHSRHWMQDQIDAIRAETPDDVVTGYVDIWRRIVEGTHFQAGPRRGRPRELLASAARSHRISLHPVDSRYRTGRS